MEAPATIRPARAGELERLRDIERAAGQLFADHGLADVAAHEPLPLEELAHHQRHGRCWVAVDAEDRPVGYALAAVIDGGAHLEQLSVHPDAGRRGIGAALLEHACRWAAEAGYPSVTLTTFSHLPWNAPFYARHGFEVLAGDQLSPGLRRVMDAEAAAGLDPALRVCMRRSL